MKPTNLQKYGKIVKKGELRYRFIRLRVGARHRSSPARSTGRGCRVICLSPAITRARRYDHTPRAALTPSDVASPLCDAAAVERRNHRLGRYERRLIATSVDAFRSFPNTSARWFL
ncbi:hypothetical protein EVAR_88588_1 [Eumeta japonica]|uniref:Uncharacterized protein n=1 Tax=Eumeta variegata TaxID=151549 RepID=A0A4C1Y7H9_EUMVA|nr:hypothetical protein EVAR_88588_1 [Eumeta japonica]